MVVRLTTGFIGAPLILALLYLGPPWGWAVFVAVAAAVGAVEFFGMTHPGDSVMRVLGVVMVLGAMATLWFFGASSAVLLTLIMAVPIVSMMLVLWRLGDIQTAALRVASTAFGVLYLGGGLGSIILLRRDSPGSDGPPYVVLALTLAWLSDTGAYFAGRFLGKHKLYPAVSPKKTVEGALGGLCAGVLGAVVLSMFFLRTLPVVHAVVLAIVAGALGQAGDLGESLLKRSSGVKDSGGIVPGHGGILDRTDALLVTSTLTYLYVLWTR